jgi:flagellar motor component MotA
MDLFNNLVGYRTSFCKMLRILLFLAEFVQKLKSLNNSINFMNKEYLMVLNYLFAVLAIGISAVLTVLFSGGGITTYLDVPSALITVIFPFIYQWALFGPSVIKKAFTAGFKKSASMEDIKKSQFFFKSYAKIVWFSVLLAVAIGTVAMLKNLEDRTMLGPNLAVTLISLLYATIIEVVIIIPYLVILKRRMTELDIEI